MRISGKFLSLLLGIVMLLMTVVPCATAFAESTGYCPPPEGYANIEIPDNATATVDWDALADCLFEGIYNHEESIDISSFNIPISDENMQYIKNILYDTPKIMCQSNGFNYSYNSTIYTKITPKYQYDADEFKKMVEKAQASVDGIVGDLKNSALSDAEKVLMVHDRLAVMNEYDYANYLTESIPASDYNAYGALCLGSTVCQGISYAMIWCLDELGIESYYNSSNALKHGWVMAVIDGEFYHIDITGDDPVWDQYGRCLHKNLLISTETFNTSASNHNNDGNIVTDFDTSPTDKTYEGYYWEASDTAIQFLEGNLYYINTDDGTLCKRTPNGDTTVLKTISSKWYASETSYYGKGAEYSRLTSHGTKLIYNTADTIYAYDINSGEEEAIYTVDITANGYNCIYALTKLGDSLKIVLSNTPNFDAATQANAVSLKSTEAKIEAVKAYCTTTGLTEGTKCSVCGTIYTAQETVPARGHTRDSGTVTTPASCVATGIMSYTCTVCGEPAGTEVIPARGHTRDSGTVTTPASCIATGVMSYTCTVCGEPAGTEVIAKTAHVDNDKDGICDNCKTEIPDPSANCSCNCHKSGFMGFIWKIQKFFYKIFGTNRTCSCGAAHY